MMTEEETIIYLAEKRQEYQKWLDITPNPESTYPDICKYVKAIDVSIAALLRQGTEGRREMKREVTNNDSRQGRMD